MHLVVLEEEKCKFGGQMKPTAYTARESAEAAATATAVRGLGGVCEEKSSKNF